MGLFSSGVRLAIAGYVITVIVYRILCRSENREYLDGCVFTRGGKRAGFYSHSPGNGIIDSLVNIFLQVPGKFFTIFVETIGL